MAIRSVPRPKINRDASAPVVRVADSHLSQFAVAAGNAIRRVRDSASIEAIEQAIYTAGPSHADSVPDWGLFNTLAKADSGDMEGTYQSLIKQGARTQVELQPVFTLVDERAVELARQDAANLAVGLAEDSRAAIRTVLGNTLDGGMDVHQAARLIKDVVGLNPQRAQAVANFRTALETENFHPQEWRLADMRYAYTNLSQEQIDARVALYADRHVADRARVIARTETMSAATQGQTEIWSQAADAGLIDRNTAVMVWVLTDDACDDCGAMDGETAPIDTGFDDPPPLHPNCRCALSLDTGDVVGE